MIINFQLSNTRFMKAIAKKLHRDRDEILNFCSKFDRIHLFGTGFVGEYMFRYLKEENVEVCDFLVSKGERKRAQFHDICVKEMDEVELTVDDGIIIAVKEKFRIEILDGLLAKGINEKNIYCQRIVHTSNNAVRMYYSNIGYNRNEERGKGHFSDFFELEMIGQKSGTDKCKSLHNYLNKYEMFVSRWKELPINVLELGVYKGSSIEMWENYFHNAQIYGVDIDENCKRFNRERVHIIIQDLGDEEKLEQLGDIHPMLVIDDASHYKSHQIKSLYHLLPLIEPGGVFIMEDLGTNYSTYREMIYDDSMVSCAEVCKAIADVVLGGEFLRIENMRPELVPLKEEIEFMADQVEMVSFINESCIFVKK